MNTITVPRPATRTTGTGRTDRATTRRLAPIEPLFTGARDAAGFLADWDDTKTTRPHPIAGTDRGTRRTA